MSGIRCSGRFAPVLGLAVLPMLCSNGISAQLEPNTDRWGMDFRDFVVPENPRACLAACRAEPRCRAFTFRTAAVAYGRPHCWLKSDIPPARYAQGATSGIVRPEVAVESPAFEQDTDPGGSDYRDFAVPENTLSFDVSQYIHDSWKVQEGFTWSRINSIAQTPDGYLWLGTDDARSVAAGTGLYRFDGERNIRWEPPPGQQLPSNLVSCLLAARDGTLWIGTANGLASLKNGKITHYEGLARYYIFTILEDRGGTVWVSGIGTPTGRLCAIQASSIHCYGEDGNLGIGVMALYEDRKGNLWAAVVNGFWRWKPGAPAFYSMPGAVDGIRAFIEGDGGGLLFTTRGGLRRLVNRQIEPYLLPGNKQQPRIMRMLRARDGGLWLGTWDRGIVHVHQGKTDAYYNGLSGVDIAALLEDHEGDIWAVTSEGLDRFRDPSSKTRPPPVIIRQIIADGIIYAAFNGLHLPAQVRDLAIDYTALTLVAPDKIHFRYRLEGQDPNWREVVNERRVQYSNLAPRHYIFRVMACNNSGVWNEAGDTLEFSIAPAWFQTTWFLASCVAAVLALLAAADYLRIQYLKRQFHVGLEARVAERTRIARDFHDTTLQIFQGVLMKLGTIPLLMGDRQPEVREKLEGMLEQGRQAVTEGRNAVQGLRSSTVVTNDLARAIRALATELMSERNGRKCPEFDLKVEGETTDLAPLVRDDVHRIGCEAVRNVFTHAQAGRLAVEICYARREFRLLIRDDGKGIDEKVLADGGRAGHHGLPGMQERARLVGGELAMRSRPGNGTELELTIPASLAYAKAPPSDRSMSSGTG